MSVTLNLTDREAHTVIHLIENELQGMVTGSVPEDDEYRDTLESVAEKARRQA